MIHDLWKQKREGMILKYFNTTAVCIPSKHYMVDILDCVKSIKKLVDDGKHFAINCARQYGRLQQSMRLLMH